MATYKRATKQLQSAGITDIQIDKSLYGATPHLIGVRRQVSQTFKTPELAVAAVLAGFRPTNGDEPQAPPQA